MCQHGEQVCTCHRTRTNRRPEPPQLPAEIEEHRMRKHVTITVDGEDLVLMGGEHPTQYALEVAGVHPSRFDLLRIDAGGKHVVTHHPGDMVVLADGDEFVTARISTGTA